MKLKDEEGMLDMDDVMNRVVQVRNEAETVRLARLLGPLCFTGCVLALDGDLGAGKTRFAQALAASLGVPGVVNSPTFTIIKQYDGGRLPFYHMDMYRIDEQQASELGLDEYFDGDGMTVVEWASRLGVCKPAHRLDLYMERQGDGEERLFHLMPHGGRHEHLCHRWMLEIGGV